MISYALNKMKDFHDDLCGVFQSYNMDLLENLGRRNVLLSQAQEEFFAQALSQTYDNVVADGATGQPDIVIHDIDKEIECKLTSPYSAGGISFQTDYETLERKGKRDYLYVIASKDFKSFAVLHFEGLTIDDFRPLSNGYRGKAQMYKHKGLKKCQILLGNVINNKI